MKKHAAEVALSPSSTPSSWRGSAASRASRTSSERIARGSSRCATSMATAESDGDVSLCLTGGTLTWMHYLYLSNRGCPKAAGEISQGELRVLDSKSHGVNDLEAIGSNGCAGHDFTWTRFGWNGKAIAKPTRQPAPSARTAVGNPHRARSRHAYCKRELSRRKQEHVSAG